MDTTDEAGRYAKKGHVALPRLFAVEVLNLFYNRMVADLTATGRPLPSFRQPQRLTGGDAIEVYGYQYPPMLALLWGLTPRMALIAGCELLPTYCYFRLYRRGDVCRVHSDRPACEHSLSLTIGYADGQPWALSVADARCEPSAAVADDFGGEVYSSVAMAAGDAVAYQGVHRRHGRTEPNPNASSAHLFLHWVDRAGPYAGEAFDLPTMRRAGLA